MQKVQVEPFKMIGIAVRTTNENTQAAKDITELWGRFLSKNLIHSIPNKIDTTVYCMYTEYESDHTKPYTTLLGCKVTDLGTIPVGMKGISVDGGEYVKLTAKGDLMKGLVANQWYSIWNMDLPRAFTADYEVYGANAQNPTDAEVDFLIALK